MCREWSSAEGGFCRRLKADFAKADEAASYRDQLGKANPYMRERQFKEEQIVGTQEKPQWIVAQRLLSHLQYLDATKSSAKDLSPAQFNLLLLEDSLAKIPAAEIRLGLFLFT
jgi:hypothetical protein